MNPQEIPIFCLLVPALATVGIWINGRMPNLREGVTLVSSLLLFGLVLMLIPGVMAGHFPEYFLIGLLPNLPLVLNVEPLGLIFALVASSLWILTSIYAIGYMRGNNEAHQTRFFMCFALSITATIGIAFAGNLLTLFIFYEMLTLSTFPLVTHAGNEKAMRAGRVYLGILLSTSICFFLFAIIWTWQLTGTLDFLPGGILKGKVEPGMTPILLGLFVFGIGKAALMPFHRWLPAAMVAPTPVSALLHAVAVVKAGVFCILKVTVYIFGLDLLRETGAHQWFMWAAAFTILTASLVALTKDNLKARLAYSTISQLSYIVLGAMLATSMGILGGTMHVVMHAFGKITLFFCAGAIYTAARTTEISDMDGLGRIMPVTFGAFLVGALSIIGLPPLGGSWSKWYLILGAADSGQYIMIGVLLISSLLNIAYLIPIPVRAFFRPLPGVPPASMPEGHEVSGMDRIHIKEAPLLCVFPLCLSAAGCILLFFAMPLLFEALQLIPTQ